MYMSQERFDLQYAVKSSATDLKSPMKHSWKSLNRLVGYVKATEFFCEQDGENSSWETLCRGDS